MWIYILLLGLLGGFGGSWRLLEDLKAFGGSWRLLEGLGGFRGKCNKRPEKRVNFEKVLAKVMVQFQKLY